MSQFLAYEITVLKTLYHQGLAEKYSRQDVPRVFVSISPIDRNSW